MKRIISIALLFLGGSFVFADMNLAFFGNNNFTIDANTTFAADLDNGATGLVTEAGAGLWFEITPYQDRNVTPQRDVLSVSLKLANSAFYAWRGYDDLADSSNGSVLPSNYGGRNKDQADSIWFNTFIAGLEYNNKYWIRIAGIEPELSVSQASIKSVFDPAIVNRGDVAKNPLPMPLFVGDANHYNGNGGIMGLLSRDIVHLNRREVEIAGNVSAGMRGDAFDVTIKAGSWKIAEENELNSWVGGGDFTWRPDLSNLINFSFLTAVNYGSVDFRKGNSGNFGSMYDPESSHTAMIENPLALGLGYEYRLNLPGSMVMKPYAGVDFIYETKSNEYNVEVGGGIQLFFRGTGAQLKRNDKIGGVNIGDVDLPVAFIAGMNADKNGLVNMVVSFNESPRFSPVPNLGGYLQFEFMNIAGKEYTTPYKYEGTSYFFQTIDDFMVAGIFQIEYLVGGKVMPYIFGKFIPADTRGLAPTDAPTYRKNRTSLTSKAGVRFTPIDYFYLDVWYERTDVRFKDDWTQDDGSISITVGLKNYF